MENHIEKTQNRTLASKNFDDVLLDFLLSRQAMMCTNRTIDWYKYIFVKIIKWLLEQNVEEPHHISSKHIRAFLGELAQALTLCYYAGKLNTRTSVALQTKIFLISFRNIDLYPLSFIDHQASFSASPDTSN